MKTEGKWKWAYTDKMAHWVPAGTIVALCGLAPVGAVVDRTPEVGRRCAACELLLP